MKTKGGKVTGLINNIHLCISSIFGMNDGLT